MNLGQLRREVEILIDDESFDSFTVDQYINQALRYATELVKFPSLKRFGTVTVGGTGSNAYGDIEDLGISEFSGILTRVTDEDGSEVTIMPKLESLIDKYPTMEEVGDVESVALEGNILWFQKIPESPQTLAVVFYKTPDLLSANSDKPIIPEHLQRSLLVHGAAWMIYDQIEDGIEGKKVNTINHHYHSFDESNKESGIVKLREWIAVRRIHHISSIWSA